MSKRARILVVEDSLTNRTLVVSAIQDEFECITAENGEKALEIIRSQSVDAVLTDLHMPQMDGVQLLRALRESETTKSLPVMVMTTETGLEEVNECRRLGCTGYVLKPVEKSYLLAKLRRLFGTGSTHV